MVLVRTLPSTTVILISPLSLPALLSAASVIQQAFLFKTHHLPGLSGYDDMIQHLDIHHSATLFEPLCDCSVLLARAGRTTGMIVYGNECSRIGEYAGFEYFSWTDHRSIQRAYAAYVQVDHLSIRLQVENSKHLSIISFFTDRGQRISGISIML